MWIDSDGVSHTVAVPDPGELMDRSFHESLEALFLAGEADDLLQWVECEQEALLETGLKRTESEGQFVGRPAPKGLLAGTFDDLAGLARVLSRIDLRWRLDALLALEDLALGR
ncbi:hypothetical protein [Pimelobacter simplex]|uniref:hypothetical protein n=1 Tax=Nocardioides simplex TaxID=2045 RepID=UPI003AAEAA00